MKRTLLLLPAIACLSLSVFAQVPVDKTVSLQSVEIQGKRFGGLTGGEVKRLQVDSNLSGLTGTTADVFRLLPSVVTDIEGGITFRGSNNPGLLINGVPYGLLEEYSGDMLIQLPALFFDRVSMTSTPSIGLVPDGDAGILNLSSAVYTAADSPLVLTLGAGFQERYNAGAILNLHPGKFHIVGKYNYRREFRKRTFSKSTTNKGGTTVMNNNASARPDVHLADLSVGYDLTANDLITVYGLYNLMDYSRYGKIHNNKLVDGNLQPVASTQFKDKTMIISVFPSVDTSVCALQNIRFNREAARLDKDVVILSLSVDLPFAQKRFCAAEHIDNVRVYSDYRDLDFGMKYGFVIKELRLLGRGVVVVDRKGIVRYIEYVSEIKNEPDYDAALKAVRELK